MGQVQVRHCATWQLAQIQPEPRTAGVLLSTGDSVLVEASPYDAIWGIRLAASSPEAQDPMKWRGQNLLGFALMEVRDELRRVTQNEMLCDWSMVWQQ